MQLDYLSSLLGRHMICLEMMVIHPMTHRLTHHLTHQDNQLLGLFCIAILCKGCLHNPLRDRKQGKELSIKSGGIFTFLVIEQLIFVIN